ncbi:MAG TPA: aminotransferase class I/II-fold pyridoxal phosphate-dependent enzyme [Ilumatobacteraceae bacterium]
MPTRVIDAVTDRTARGIAAAVSRLVTDGELRSGERLPTVRALARQLGVSPTTVSEAWQVLADAGAIDTRGRLGTFVVGPPSAPGPRRYRNVSQAHGTFSLDLSTGTPDPALLPDLAAVLTRVSRQSLTTSYLDDPVLPALGDVLRDAWPFPPEALTVMDGAMDALDRVITTLVRLGDRVVVEQATFPPLLDLLEQLGADIIGVDVDDDGIVPASLKAALAHDPVALFTQPRAHNPLGVGTSMKRTAVLARLLRSSAVTIVEDDHAGDIAAASLVSMGRHLPDRTILVRSFSKSHGPDLRLSAVGGSGEPIMRMARRRMLGPGWSSRLLQAVLAELLVDEPTVATIADARVEYARRRAAVSDALAERGVPFSGTDGINLWVDVDDERTAQLGLAARGIGVAPGSPFLVASDDRHHLRITVGLVRDGASQLADHVADAASTSRRHRHSVAR